jgi:hypothetical protein
MAGRWRDRVLPPVYALAITFALVSAAGAVPHWRPPAAKGLAAVQFVGPQPDPRAPAPRVPELLVRVRLADGARQDARVPPGGFTLVIPDQDATICLGLPAGWSAEGFRSDEPGDDACRNRVSGEVQSPVVLRGN